MRVALVTGGAGGIGDAICRKLAASCRVVVHDVKEDAAKALAGEVGGSFVGGNLADGAVCQSIIDQVAQEHGRLDILLNNAGFQHIAPIDSFPDEKWEAMMAVMVNAPFRLTKYAWPIMKEQGRGRIVNMASIHGLVASVNKAGYITAKHALVGLTRATALEGGPHGITVNAICPAYVRTPLVENQVQGQAETLGIAPEEVEANVFLKSMVTEKMIEPAEVAGLVHYLCSDEARSITGACFTIDGGWTAQ